MSADLWAGAEVQVATMASYLVARRDVELTAVLLNEGPLAVELRRLGVPVTVLDEHRTNAIRILTSLTRLFRDRPVDIVHTHRYKDTVLGAIAARVAGVPGVMRTVHGQSEPMRGWDRAKFRVYEALETLTLRCVADRIVAVSRRLAESLEEAGYDGGRVVHIHNGVDLGRIRPTRPRDQVRRELGIDAGTPLIGTVGRLSPVKGHADLLRAAKLILQEEKGARFIIVGDGPLRSELVATAKQLGVERACAFAGARTDVYDLVAAMDVFVLPSLGEGIPMALLEAMALGRPAVATAVGGVPEIVVQGETGLLVPAGDERALAGSCLELILDRGRAQALGARASRVVAEAFSHEKSGRALVEAYRDIASGRTGARTARVGLPQARGDRAARRHPRLLGFRPRTRKVRVRLSPAKLARGLVPAARRVYEAAVSLPDRRRMERIRRAPSALEGALQSARRILIVCHGNIIRSAFTARLVRQALGGGKKVLISSAGLAAVPGTSPPPAAIRAAARLDVDLGDHVASGLSAAAVAMSDVVLVMEIRQLRAIHRRFPEARGKTFLLTCLAADWPLEVSDPFDRDDSAFRACFEHISASVRPVVRLLTEDDRHP